jgi:hypothetical protein
MLSGILGDVYTGRDIIGLSVRSNNASRWLNVIRWRMTLLSGGALSLGIR